MPNGTPGQPTLYKPEHVQQAYEWCQKFPLTNKDLAKLFDVAEDTIYEWKKRHPEFSEAINRGKSEKDVTVERSLYERATGYSHPEEKIFVNQGEVIRAETVKHYPPDPTSMIFWLKNRQPEQWRDKVEVEAHHDIQIVWQDDTVIDVTPEAKKIEEGKDAPQLREST